MWVTLAHSTRRHIEYNSTWELQTHKTPGVPLIEDSNKQTIPTTTRVWKPQLPTWEHKLKDTSKYFFHQLSQYTEVSKFLQLDLASADTIWIISDGGKDSEIGYYGWVIADSTHILCEGNGHTTGNNDQMDSLRAESSGMLHALTVMVNFLRQGTCNPKIKLGSDNLLLVKRTKLICEYGSRLPTQYTAPHMDIQCIIDSLIVENIFDIEVTHVKGHQDTKKQGTLTWEETLNVRADQLATMARFENKPLTYLQQCSWHPNSVIQLFINKQPINKWLNSSIHQALTSDSLLNYLRTKLTWTHSTYQEVDWPQKTAASHKVPKNQIPWLIKLGTDRLPLNGEKFHQSPTIYCPLCKTSVETSDHFLTCCHYPTIATSCLKELTSTYNKYNVDPYLRILLTRAIKGLKCDTYHLCQAHPTFPINDYKLLLHSQQKIGWINFLKGYPSTHWMTHQQRYKMEMYIDDKPTDAYWLQHVYSTLFKIYYARWQVRNQTQHGPNDEYTKQALLLRISALYALKDNMHPQDQHCFRKPLKDWD